MKRFYEKVFISKIHGVLTITKVNERTLSGGLEIWVCRDEDFVWVFDPENEDWVKVKKESIKTVTSEKNGTLLDYGEKAA